MAMYNRTKPAAPAARRASREPQNSEVPRRTTIASPTKESPDALAGYLSKLQDGELLTAADEQRLSVAIEQHEIETWSMVLDLSIWERIVAAIATQLETPPLSAIAAWRKASAIAPTAAAAAKKRAVTSKIELAKELRNNDLDRQHIDFVVSNLGRWGTSAAASELAWWPRSKAAKEADKLAAIRATSRKAAALRNEFVNANLRLVVTMARRYDRGQMALPDLIQEGNLGLIHAIGRFDHRRGLRFSTYACWWIRHAIGRAIADKGRAVRVPVHMLEAQHQIEKVRRELTRELGRQPNLVEIAKAARVPVQRLEQMTTFVMGQSVSLDKPVVGDDDRTFGDTLADPSSEASTPAETMTIAGLNREVLAMLTHLSPIEADVLSKRFGIGDDQERTFREIGDEYKLSRERIRQIQNGALDKLKAALTKQHRGNLVM